MMKNSLGNGGEEYSGASAEKCMKGAKAAPAFMGGGEGPSKKLLRTGSKIQTHPHSNPPPLQPLAPSNPAPLPRPVPASSRDTAPPQHALTPDPVQASTPPLARPSE